MRELTKSAGFSLLELMLAMTIVIVIAIWVFPSSFSSLKRSSSMDLAKEQLLHAIEMARNEAIMRNQIILLVKQGEWDQGYLIKMGNQLLYSFAAMPAHTHLYWRAFGNHPQLIFLPTGMTYAENGTFWLCEEGSQYPSWAIALNQAGHARLMEAKQLMVLGC